MGQFIWYFVEMSCTYCLTRVGHMSHDLDLVNLFFFQSLKSGFKGVDIRMGR